MGAGRGRIVERIACLSCGQTFIGAPADLGLCPLCGKRVNGILEVPALLTKRHLAGAWLISLFCALAYATLGVLSLSNGDLVLGTGVLVASALCFFPVALSVISRDRAAVWGSVCASFWGFVIIGVLFDLCGWHDLPKGDEWIIIPLFCPLILLMGFATTCFMQLSARVFCLSCWLVALPASALGLMTAIHMIVPAWSFSIFNSAGIAYFKGPSWWLRPASMGLFILGWVCWIGLTAIKAHQAESGQRQGQSHS